MNTDATYVEIIHLSDLHFGEGHVFTAEATPDGTSPADTGMPTLADKIIEDVTEHDRELGESLVAVSALGPNNPQAMFPPMPRILCLSGDFTQKGTLQEFQQAQKFVERLRDEPQLRIVPGGVFLCPGNHDLAWSSDDDTVRWDQYAGLLSRLTNSLKLAKDAMFFGGLEICRPAKTVVLSLNTETKVFAADGEKSRGDLHIKQLTWVRESLENLPDDVRREYVKVAMVHHHPVLLPSSAEANRGYDAINGADKLLPLLHEHRFHVVLHGHKHYPHTFREDVRNAFIETDDHSLFIVAGGTCGSNELPTPRIATQCYNRIRVHWCGKEATTRVQVITRGLVTRKAGGAELLADKWHFRTLTIDDRHHLAHPRRRMRTLAQMQFGPSVSRDSAANTARKAEYALTHGYFPVAEVLPAMVPGQTAEVRLRIVAHGKGYERKPGEILKAVTWSGGDKWFPTVRVTREEDPDFHAIFTYWGGALLQAELEFIDGSSCITHVYVPMINSQTTQ